MRRETKVNLGFLIGFLILSAPGVTMLFIKKLDPAERKMFAPPFVRTTSTYNNPIPTRSDTVRVVPAKTRAWVEQIARERLGVEPLRAAAAGGRADPIVSDGRSWELLAIAPSGSGEIEIALLAWLDDFGHERVGRVEGDITWPDSARSPLTRIEVETLATPAEVLAELKAEGYVVPPARVAVVRLRAAGPPSGTTAGRLEVSWETATDRRSDALQLLWPLPAGPSAGKDEPASRPTIN